MKEERRQAQEEQRKLQQQLEELRNHVQAAEQEVVQIRLQLTAELEKERCLREETQKELEQVSANVCWWIITWCDKIISSFFAVQLNDERRQAQEERRKHQQQLEEQQQAAEQEVVQIRIQLTAELEKERHLREEAQKELEQVSANVCWWIVTWCDKIISSFFALQLNDERRQAQEEWRKHQQQLEEQHQAAEQEVVQIHIQLTAELEKEQHLREEAQKELEQVSANVCWWLMNHELIWQHYFLLLRTLAEWGEETGTGETETIPATVGGTASQ